MLIVWKVHYELGDKVAALLRRIRNVAEAGKQETGSVARAIVDMTVRADRWGRPLARKELFAMTIQTRRVLRKLGHIREGRISLAYFLPITGWELVTGIAGQLLLLNVSRVPEL